MELPSETAFPLSNRYYDHCKNVFYIFSMQQLSGKHIPSLKSCSLLVLTITEQMESNNTEEIWHKSCILSQLLRTKTLASASKCIKHFFLFLPLFALYVLSGCDLFNMSCFS